MRDPSRVHDLPMVETFPAMVICSLIIFMSAPWLPERPLGMPLSRDLLPGITFLDQNVWRHFLGGNQGILGGAFWSLFVELKFYVIFGGLYFVVGRTFATIGIVLACLVEAAANRNWLPLPDIVRSLLAFMEVKHFCWLASGALFYIYYHDAGHAPVIVCDFVGTFGRKPGRTLADPFVSTHCCYVIYQRDVFRSLAQKCSGLSGADFYGFCQLSVVFAA